MPEQQQGDTAVLERTETVPATQTPWICLLHNDPINFYTVVIQVLQKVLHCTHEEADRLTMIAHLDGRVAVKTGTLEECTQVAAALGQYSLWATIEQSGGAK